MARRGEHFFRPLLTSFRNFRDYYQMRTSAFVISIVMSVGSFAADIPSNSRSVEAIAGVKHKLERELSEKGLAYGSPIFVRIFKASAELEMWVRADEKYELFRTYEICNFSGALGPKTRQGDNQAPEGFYFVKPGNLNPWSSYHLSFNLGYPNTYDRYHGYTGSALMVHGKCVSIGCYAMTDEFINEIYTMAHGALENGQPFFRVHIFPFRLDAGALEKYEHNRWFTFWENLKEGYDYFNMRKLLPNVVVKNGIYHFEEDRKRN